jgi:hypothetical protein
MAKTPSLNASVRLVLTAPPFLGRSSFAHEVMYMLQAKTSSRYHPNG